MNHAAKSAFYFGIYVVLLGLTLAMAPALVVTPFGFDAPQEPWIRVMGVVVFTLGGYYVQAARTGVTAFIRWTIVGRSLILAGFIALVIAGIAKPALIIFGVVDGAAAFWTFIALKRDEQKG